MTRKAEGLAMARSEITQGARFVAYGLADQVRERPPLVVVDIGYSAVKRSCGLAWEGGGKGIRCTFGACIKRVGEQLLALPTPLLVVEGVLSTYHDSQTGNPDIRGEFERGRGWYWGPGAVSLVAARRFLEQLPGDHAVLLAEAFLSNKKAKTGHEQDAAAILANFWDVRAEALREGTEPLSPLIDGVPSVRVFEPPQV